MVMAFVEDDSGEFAEQKLMDLLWVDHHKALALSASSQGGEILARAKHGCTSAPTRERRWDENSGLLCFTAGSAFHVGVCDGRDSPERQRICSPLIPAEVEITLQ